jgi:hypothetical protein
MVGPRVGAALALVLPDNWTFVTGGSNVAALHRIPSSAAVPYGPG